MTPRLGDIAKIESGYSFKSSDWLEAGLPVVKIKNIKDGVIDLTDCGLISEQIAQKAKSFEAHPRDVLISLTGYVGQVGRVGLGDKVYVNQRVGLVRPIDPEDLDYIYYLLRFLKPRIESLAVGSAQANVSPLRIMELEIPNVTRKARHAIGKFLRSYDDLITLNASRASALVALSQIIYKSWFIDFEPVKAKMEPELMPGLNTELQELFPNSMQQSEQGEIPSGWTSTTIKDICEKISNGATPSRSVKAYWDSPDINWFKTGELYDGFLSQSKELVSRVALQRTSTKSMPMGTVLMAIYAAPTVGRLGILSKESAFNQACTGLLARESFGMEFLYLSLFFRRRYFNSLAIGAAQQNISKAIVEDCPVVIASPEVHQAFKSILEGVFGQLHSLTSLNQNLADVRDALLLRFMSGELHIPDEMLES